MKHSGAFSPAELESFLTSTTVPIRIGCRTPADRPWMLSLWYQYEDGVITCSTAADAAVVSYLEYDDVVSFEISTNDVPYRGVRGNATARMEPDPDKTVLKSLLRRYLGGTDTPLGEWLLSADRDEVRITLDPAVVHSWDYSSRMSE